jgi:hypothetical protein
MALKTNYPKPQPPTEPQPKDLPAVEHDTTSGPRYGTTEGVKPDETTFEQVERPKAEVEKEVAAEQKDVLDERKALAAKVPAKSKAKR